MYLLLDMGNSYLHWAYYLAPLWQQSGSVAYKSSKIAKLDSVIPIKMAYLASVADKKQQLKVIDWVEFYWQQPVEIVSVSPNAYGVSNAYPDYEKLGIDRWLALLASFHHYPGLSCIVDCGTAITIDVLQPDGLHLGGWILPGFNLMQQSLVNNTAQISLQTGLTELKLANNTQSAIANGIVYSMVALIKQLKQQLEQQYDLLPQLIITGGAAELILPHLDMDYHYDKLLVLKGLALFVKD